MKPLDCLVRSFCCIFRLFLYLCIMTSSHTDSISTIKQDKYVLCRPICGFVDILTQIERCYLFCKEHNYVLLLDTENTLYKEALSNSFTFVCASVPTIQNTSDINNIIKNKNLTYVVSAVFTNDRSDVDQILRHNPWIDLDAVDPKDITKYDIIVPYLFGGGNEALSAFRKMIFKKWLIDIVVERFLSIPYPYLGIYVRDTDYKSDYRRLYRENIREINSYKHIYIASDNNKCIQYFKSRCKTQSIYNFTTFPDKNYDTLHTSDIDPQTKVTDMISDMCIIALSDRLLSNSLMNTNYGGFRRILGSLNLPEGKKKVMEKLGLDKSHIIYHLNNLVESKYLFCKK